MDECELYHNTIDFLNYLVWQNKEVSDKRENFLLKTQEFFFSSVILKVVKNRYNSQTAIIFYTSHDLLFSTVT